MQPPPRRRWAGGERPWLTCSQLQCLEHIVPSDRIALSWSTNAPAISEIYEMEAQRTEDRLGEARICREHG